MPRRTNQHQLNEHKLPLLHAVSASVCACACVRVWSQRRTPNGSIDLHIGRHGDGDGDDDDTHGLPTNAHAPKSHSHTNTHTRLEKNLHYSRTHTNTHRRTPTVGSTLHSAQKDFILKIKIFLLKCLL